MRPESVGMIVLASAAAAALGLWLVAHRIHGRMDGGLFASAALLAAGASAFLATASRFSDVAVGAGAMAVVLTGSALALRASSPPPCTYRPGHPGESAAHYYGLREIPAGATRAPRQRATGVRPRATPPAPTATARTYRFHPGALPRPGADLPQGRRRRPATRRAMAGAELQIDWSSFDTARAAYELGLRHDSQRSALARAGRADDPARPVRDRRNRSPLRCALPAPDLPIGADGGPPGRPYRRTMLTPEPHLPLSDHGASGRAATPLQRSRAVPAPQRPR